MNSSYPLKNLPAPLQSLIRPMLFISLALHGLLLLVPMSEEKNEADAQKKEVEKSVKVTQLPTTPTARPSPQASPKAPTPQPAERRVVTPVTRQPILTNRPQPAIKASPSPRQTQASPSSKAASSPVSPATTTSSSSATAPDTGTALSDFPTYPGAKPGCLDVSSCFQTGNQLNPVAAYFEKELPARKFTSTEAINEPDRKVYQVSRSDFPTQYLSLIETEQGTIYVLAEEPRTLDDIRNAVVVPPEVYNILANVGEEVEDENAFANPNEFYTKLSSQDADGSLIPAELREDIQSQKLVLGQNPAAVYASMQPNLQGIFEVSESGSYGGGSLYKLKKSSFTGYLNLVPNKDGTGTIVVLWTKRPA